MQIMLKSSKREMKRMTKIKMIEILYILNINIDINN